MRKRALPQDISPYPHIVVTREAYPRFLTTRNLDNEGVDYFGAFLTKTAVRILIDFLNRTFRLRSCDIELDGNLPVPCTQYFKKRCLAPCVRAICSKEDHAEAAEGLRIFLRNDRVGFKDYVNAAIDQHSEKLEFERAAFWRDVFTQVEAFWQNPRLNVWLNDAVDTYHVEEREGEAYVFLATTRGRYALGKQVFTSDDGISELPGLMGQLYRFYVPREIRVNMDFLGRKELANQLSKRFDRDVPIVISGPDRITQSALRAFKASSFEVELDSIRERIDESDVNMGLRELLGSRKNPDSIEAVDVSHISGTGVVGAASVWHDGSFVKNEYGFELFESLGEASAIGVFISDRYERRPPPDLVLIDGGKSQLNAAVRAAVRFKKKPAFLSAVKPPGKHSEVSHFLTEAGGRIEFDPGNASHLLLQVLRDEAHELANYVHGEIRDARHFYESTGTEPLVVPIRFTTNDGSAEGLRPIVTKNRPNEKPKSQRKPRSTALYRPLGRAR
jgi:excinuclease ABC subunit C